VIRLVYHRKGLHLNIWHSERGRSLKALGMSVFIYIFIQIFFNEEILLARFVRRAFSFVII